MKENKFKLITNYSIEEYKCGLKAGDYVRLIKDIVVINHLDQPTGEVYPAGEVWKVLHGAPDDPNVVFLLQADGDRHTWDDDKTIYEQFEIVKDGDELIRDG
jgi:hypothetical protein